MTSAGTLTEKVTILKMISVPDGGGGSTVSWEPLLTARAAIKVLTAQEAVMQGRLEGIETLVSTLRYQQALATADTTCRLRNERTGRQYNVRGITPDPRLQWCDVLCTTDGT
jgi:SPP1 family predicted phage head-tail adaptor